MRDDTGQADVTSADSDTGAGTDADGDARPATMVATWDVVPGREAAFETWAHELNRAAADFPGHLGATWLRAEGSRHRYYTVLNFTDQDRLSAWLRSPEREERIRRVDGIAEQQRRHTTGLETWFSLPGESVPAPPRWKMVLVTLGAVYPLSVLFQGVVAPVTTPTPLLLRAAMFPVVMVPTLTYLVMPGLSRLFRRWLYPPHRSHPPAQRTRPRREDSGPSGREV
jgi:uncharacterized protein